MTVTSDVLCPVCKVSPAPGTTTCPDCGEDLAPLLHLRLAPKIRFNEALGLVRDGKQSRAIAVLESLSNGGGPAALDLLARLYAQSGRHDAARNAWEQVLLLEPNSPAATTGLAHLSDVERQQAEREAEVRRRIDVAARRRISIAALSAFVVGGLAVAVLLTVSGLGASPPPVQPALAPTLAPALTVAPTLPPTVAPTTAPTAAPAAARTVAPTALPTAVPTASPTAVPIPDLSARIQQGIVAATGLPQGTVSVDQEGRAIRLTGELPTQYLKSAAETAARISDVTFVDSGNLRIVPTYQVQPGETLWDIADRLYGSPGEWRQIAQANDLRKPDQIRSGQQLMLPR